MTEPNHDHRITTVESRTKTLEANFNAFTGRYEQDRKDDKNTSDLMFTKLNEIANDQSQQEGSRGRISGALLLTVIAVVVTVVVPITGLLATFVWQVVTPLSQIVDEEKTTRTKNHEQLINVRINQARIDERQQFILQKNENPSLNQ